MSSVFLILTVIDRKLTLLLSRRKDPPYEGRWALPGRFVGLDETAETTVRKLLEELGITSADETDIICSAIWHHDSKAEVDSPMDEILKDADVIHHSLGDPTKEIKPHELARYNRLCIEFDFRS